MFGNHEQTIRERAYAIWEQEGRPRDRNLVHWLQAEAEIGTRNLGRSPDGKDAGRSPRARKTRMRTG